MRKIKKILSLVMSLVMVVSLFAGIDITSVAWVSWGENVIDIEIADGYSDFNVGDEFICNVFSTDNWAEFSRLDAKVYFNDSCEYVEIVDVKVIDESYFSSVTIEKDEDKKWNITADIVNAPEADVDLFAVTVKAIKCNYTFDFETGYTTTHGYNLYLEADFNDYDISVYALEDFGNVNCPHDEVKDFDAVQRTCEKNGHEAGQRCINCGDWLSGEWIYSYGHEDDDEDYICDNCSESISYIKLTADNTEINSGEEFTVTVSVDNAKGLKDGKVSFAESWADETEYEIVSYEFNDNLTYEEIDSYYFDFSFDETVQSDNVDIVTVTYKPLVDDDFAMAFHVYTSDLVMYEDHEYIWIYTICLHENTTEHPEKDATCTEDGYTAGIYCEDCEEWISGHEWINYYGHEDWNEDGICDNCSGVLSYIRLTADKTEVNPGEEFTVTVSVDNSKGLKDGSITFAHAWWDEYELVSYEFNENLTYFSEYNDNNFIFSFNEAIQSDSVDIVTVTYKPLIFDEFSMNFYVRTSDLVMYDDHEYISIDVICSHENVSEKPEEAPSCTNNGYTAGEQCDDCGEWITGHEWIDSLGGHVDEDNDNFCDVCTSPATLKVGENIISSAFGDNKFKFKAEQPGLYKIEYSSDLYFNGDYYEDFSWNNLMCFSENDSMTFSVNLDHYDEETYFINITLVDDSIKGHSDKNHDEECDNCSRDGFTEYFVDFELNGSECTLNRGYEVFYLGYRIPSTDGDEAYIPYEELSMGTSVSPVETWLYPYHYEYDEEYNETLYEITEISEGAFIEFSEMKYIVIPRTVRTIGDYAVGYTAKSSDAKIENFVIYGYRDSAAEKYAEDNGFEFRVLYDYEVVDDEVVITEVCDLFTIHDIASTIDGYPVTTIGENCFADRELFYLTLPENITTIKAGAFRNNPNLGEYGIEINYTLKTVEDGAFDGCGIVGIAYYGTPEQWSEISIGENNDAFRNAEVYFNGTGNENFNYRIIDGKVVIFWVKASADIVIPETLDGYLVSDLNISSQEDSDYFGTDYYYQITIPSSVTYISPCSVGYYYDWDSAELLLIHGFKIIGVPGSYAETYANENGITFEALPEEPEEPTTEEPTTEEPTTEEPTTEEPTTEEPTTEEPVEETTTVITEPEKLVGDVNFDGKTTAADARLALRISARLEPDATNEQRFAADVVMDGRITAEDARKILRVSTRLDDINGSNDVYYENAKTPFLSLTAGTATVGETLEVVVSASDFAGTKSADMVFGFDSTKLEYIDSEINDVFTLRAGGLIGENEISLSFILLEYAESDATICTLSFKVLDDDISTITAQVLSWNGTDYPSNCQLTIDATVEEPTTEEPTTEEPTTEEPTTDELTTVEPTTKDPETEAPTTDPTTKEPETEPPTTEPTTKEPVTEAPETEPTTEEPTTEEPTTEEPTTEEPTTEEPTTEEPTTKEPERPSTDGPATDGPTEKPVSDKLEVSGDTVKVDNASKVSTVNTKSSANDILKSVKNEKVSIVDKDGKAVSGDALVGTGAKIQIKDNSGKVINTYTVCVPTDVDGNGKTTAADARLALRGSAKLDKVEGVYATASDMNADGKITAADARKILRISAGLE